MIVYVDLFVMIFISFIVFFVDVCCGCQFFGYFVIGFYFGWFIFMLVQGCQFSKLYGCFGYKYLVFVFYVIQFGFKFFYFFFILL